MNIKEIKERENKVKKQLKDQGYTLQKRVNNVNPYHSGCYRILNKWTGTIEAGANFDMALEDVEQFAQE